ncbi:unnamed protein product [Rotaria sp. Silwood1]|nr:unnamed protein product [Rotaria sp. Silwood1]CAF3391830.1 unnamed protein product [Rotaria sp. Silwood1]CAF3408503.1 unnamed protein product [Rotaria sp. Silwood1]CAF3408741.1 unnamed protein product [Rotaria sp. Silwood1]
MYLLTYLTSFLLFISLHINANIISDNEIYYPSLWQTVSSSLTEYPLVNDSSSQYRLIDSWFYPHRLDSWWVAANYYLSVIPFFAANDVGLITPQESFRIIQYANFCSKSIECLQHVPKAMT